MINIKRFLVFLFILVTALFCASTVFKRLSSDRVPPVITCSADVLEISVSDGEEALLRGVTAQDDRDGDITDRIVVGGVSKLITQDTAKVTYLVFDDGDNMGRCTRYVRYTDYEKPRFELVSPLRFGVGDTISLKDRLFASDVIDGDITDNIRVSTLDLTGSAEGVYSITVQVVNSMGDSARLELPVIVGGTSYKTPVVALTEYITYLKTGTRFEPMSYVESVRVSNTMQDTSGVEWSGEVDTDEPGVYQVTYTYTSSGGSVGSSILVVVVE